MAIDKYVMLQHLVACEDAQPNVSLSGSTVLFEAARLEEEQPSLARNNVTGALRELKRREWIDWEYQGWPNGPAEPPISMVTEDTIQWIHEIIVTESGHQALARRSPAAGTQINIVNSIVGQVAGGNLTNLDIRVVLRAAEQALETLDAPEPDKQGARTVLRRMLDAGGGVVSEATSTLLAAAVQKALGLR